MHFGYAQSSSGLNCKVAQNICPNHDIKFYLYTRNYPTDGIELNVANCNELKRQLQECKDKMFKFLVHGDVGYRHDEFNTEMRSALLKAGDYCIVSVDWSPLSQVNCFNFSARNTHVVGNCTAYTIDQIVQCAKIPLNKTANLIGYSSGAQATAFVQQNLKTGEEVESIVALDPSLFPLELFGTSDLSQQLDPSDAKWVDVHHTAAGNRSQIEPRGHSDFYWDNGQEQPGCGLIDLNIFYPYLCSHLSILEYYPRSFSGRYRARKCQYNGNLPLVNCSSKKYFPAGWPVPFGTAGVYQVSLDSPTESN
ncbi:phospholipase A1 1-like [Chrysoperla carnea]|uniref:phospholipase A1 1-like n=1 Tax=Chrysoperla carnea TaxID=189513 RepID=UPI001D08DC1E|nr:phospholipase A1 1-like [Chrysoperla carnea]